MDSKVHHLMKDDDIKLSLFVGLKKGSGKILFEEIWQKIKMMATKICIFGLIVNATGNGT